MRCKFCGEEFDAGSDPACPHCHSKLPPKEELNIADESENVEPTMGIMRFFFSEVSDAFRSSSSIVHDFYSRLLQSLGQKDHQNEGVPQLRQLYLQQIPLDQQPSPSAIMKQERRVVLVTRCCSVWNLSWMMLLPTIFAIWIGGLYSGQNLVQRLLITALLWVVFLPIGATCGAMVMPFFQWPFKLVMERILKNPNLRHDARPNDAHSNDTA